MKANRAIAPKDAFANLAPVQRMGQLLVVSRSMGY